MIEFEVKDMSCGHCASVITKTIKMVDPQAKVEVDLGSKKVRVTSSEDRVTIAEALADAGYPATP